MKIKFFEVLVPAQICGFGPALTARQLNRLGKVNVIRALALTIVGGVAGTN